MPKPMLGELLRSEMRLVLRLNFLSMRMALTAVNRLWRKRKNSRNGMSLGSRSPFPPMIWQDCGCSGIESLPAWKSLPANTVTKPDIFAACWWLALWMSYKRTRPDAVALPDFFKLRHYAKRITSRFRRTRPRRYIHILGARQRRY